MQNILITGISKGVGNGLAHYYLEQGNRVYGISRFDWQLFIIRKF